MNYYSTNHHSPAATLQEAVVRGLAPDRGLYMPEHIHPLPSDFYDGIDRLTGIAAVTEADDIELAALDPSLDDDRSST